MRTILPICCFLVACGGPDATEAPTPDAAAAQTPASSPGDPSPGAKDGKGKTAKVKPADKPLGPLPASTPVPGAPQVALLGYGLRIELQPPFQVARMGKMLGEDPDMAVWAWWDVNDPMAGKHGRLALYNNGVVPGQTVQPDAPIALTEQGEGTKLRHVLQQGADGTLVRFPQGYNALGGMGVVKPGPADRVWKFQVDDGPLIEWPDGTMAHSADPASGASVSFLTQPEKPWGPWKTPE